MTVFRIGTAGWPVPTALAGEFPPGPSHLVRYAGRFNAVEINSSFYRPHRPQTHARWAAAVPEDFRFSVKLPRTITHEARLDCDGGLLDAFLAEVGNLGARLGPLLVQLPPSLAFDAAAAGRFFESLRVRFAGAVICEPRHRTWFRAGAEALLIAHGIARAAADPALVPEAGMPGGTMDLVYVRLHGSPKMYYSAYPAAYLATLAERLAAFPAREVWCVFDNTAEGAAPVNALALLALMAAERG